MNRNMGDGMLLMISGLSGAGKSTALHALEDIGFFCTDNLPLDMLTDWAGHMGKDQQPAAVCVDTRSSRDTGALKLALESALAGHEGWRLIFLDAADGVLQRRYSILRRRHPFAPDEELLAAIRAEREAVGFMRAMADLVLDSSTLNPYELAALVESFWRQHAIQQRDIACSLVSFSYQSGLPQDADMVIDARFLPNPHYQAELAPLTGKDTKVQAFLEEQPDASEAVQHLCDWLAFLWPQLKRERKRYFTLAVGCSGGRHRSVYIVEQLAKWMREKDMADPVIRHRELRELTMTGEEYQASEERAR